MVEAFTVAAKDLDYANDTITIDQAGLNLKGNRWALIENSRGTLKDFDSFLKATKINGRASIKRLTLSDHQFENLQANISNDHGIIKSDPIDLEYFGEQARLGLDWDLREPIEQIHLRVDMPDLDTGGLLKRSEDKDLLNGKLNIKAEMKTRGVDSSAILKNINGHVSMKGKNLSLKGVDFDRALDEFQKMGAYGFNDFAALITLGPLGSMVSNGYDQLAALEKMMAAKGDSTIQQIVSNWKISKGVATASDVAFSTQRHRVALAGSLDFPTKRFQDVTIAVVDSKGCIVNKEIVDGPFENPGVKETGVIQRTVIRPLKRFLKTECEPFYDGSVPHPTSSKTN
jgi:AsmA protein